MATFKPTYRVHCTPRLQTRADFDSVTFPLVLKYVGSKDWDTQKGDRAYDKKLIIQWNQPP